MFVTLIHLTALFRLVNFHPEGLPSGKSEVHKINGSLSGTLDISDFTVFGPAHM